MTPAPSAPATPLRIVAAALAYFALVFACGFALGIPRVLLLVPRLGERMAELVEMPPMLLAIVMAARFVVTRHALPARAGPRLAVGLLALLAMLATELGVVAGLRGLDPAAWLAARDTVSGSAYALMLMVFAAMPALLRRRGSG